MRNRFGKRESLLSGLGGVLLPAVTFVLVLMLVLAGVRSIDKTTNEEQLKSLESSILKSAVQCYALEGQYPESLSYLKEHYGITYDASRYMVSYQAYGANMLPTIKVIALK